jgi:acyl carrier protein
MEPPYPLFHHGPANSDLDEYNISLQHGIQAFEYALSSGQRQIVIATSSLQDRLRESQSTIMPKNKKKAKHCRPQLDTLYVTPKSATEKAIAEIYQEIFGIEKVGVADSFWELGGESLLATQLISRLRDIFQVGVSLQTVFDEPTVAGLAEYIDIAQKAVSDNATIKNEQDEEWEEGTI